MSTWNMLSFQDPNSIASWLLITLHDFNMIFLISMMVLVGYYIVLFMYNSISARYILHGNLLEIVWTVFPMFILCEMAIPSLKILYYNENMPMFSYTIKSMGHQWYWAYSYHISGISLSFDSYMIGSDMLRYDNFRLLDVDNRLILPTNVFLRNLVTSLDVIHSWAVPSLGLKVDAVPGRLNQISMFISRSGLYYGQCSEICGMNHSFMPIVIEAIMHKRFSSWIGNIVKRYLLY